MRKCSEISEFEIKDGLSLKRQDGSKVHFSVLKDGKEIGGASLYHSDACEFWNLSIYPGYRRQGIARDVYEFVEKTFYSGRCDKIKLTAVSTAVEFWERMGFKQTRAVPGLDIMEKAVPKRTGAPSCDPEPDSRGG